MFSRLLKLIYYLLSSFQRTKFESRPLKTKQSFDFANVQGFPYYSLERRWSSRRFSYGYLVTTSPQLLISPSTDASKRLAIRLRAPPTPVVWRAVCTRPGNVFTVACWSTITSDSNFMESSCRLQSGLRHNLRIRSLSLSRCPLFMPL